MNISSRQLKAFVLTARHQSFSRAAEQLFITQSGMSVLVRELEGQLGFRLFDRTTRKVALTEFGTKFLPIADRSLLELEAAASLIGRAPSGANRRTWCSTTSRRRSRWLRRASAVPSFRLSRSRPAASTASRCTRLPIPWCRSISARSRAAAGNSLRASRTSPGSSRATSRNGPSPGRPSSPERASGIAGRLLQDRFQQLAHLGGIFRDLDPAFFHHR